MTEARTVTATFSEAALPPPITRRLTVTKSGSGSGLVTSSPSGISCGSSCAADFEAGTSVTLTVSPASGSSFSGWAGACSGTGTCTVSMTEARTVTAGFTATASQSDYTIQLVFDGPSFTPARRAVFEQAAARWSDVITGNLSSVTVPASAPIRANTCGAGHPSFSGVIDDILIFANIGPIDGPGGILGQAGPCFLRQDGTGLPVVGFMQFDEADIAVLESQGTFESVILHEMGHVFGIGTLWEVPGLGFDFLEYTTNPPGASCRNAVAFTVPPGFTGAAARAEYAALGGSGNVPVENDYGPGTRCGHWDEGRFGNELMTGFAEPAGTPMPLSRLTAASLGDLGYEVNIAASDPYSIPACTPNCDGLRTAAIDQPWEIILSPIGFLTPTGIQMKYQKTEVAR